MGHFILILCDVIGFITMLLTLIVFLSPVVVIPTDLALMTISPMLSNDTSSTINAPTIRMGLLGSCTQKNSSSNCTAPTFFPKYDFTSIPNYSPSVHAPTSTAPVWVLMGLIMYIVFLVVFTMSKLHDERPETIPRVFGNHTVVRANVYWGLLSWLILLSAFTVNYGVFVNSANNFNSQLGQGGPGLQANTSNGFVVIWVVLGFSSVPLIIMFSDLHAAYRLQYKKEIECKPATLNGTGQDEKDSPKDLKANDLSECVKVVDLETQMNWTSDYIDMGKGEKNGSGMCLIQ